MTADRLSLATRVRKARRASTCPACRVPISIGQPIAQLVSPPGWIHVGCVPAVTATLGQRLDGPARPAERPDAYRCKP